MNFVTPGMIVEHNARPGEPLTIERVRWSNAFSIPGAMEWYTTPQPILRCLVHGELGFYATYDASSLRQYVHESPHYFQD